ncbi:MAG TPA: M1 family metallopeptidase [Gemmatimonadales bacterium]|nr:M1 family metallopeptidase [Gemmatimonadales bacterium]
MLFLVALLAASDTTSYWQQQVAYRITASLNESTGVLTGHERIVYVNRSPDVLRDFYVHSYLNAFRPGSRWAAVDSAEGRVRFQHLSDPDYAFERITAATVMGQALRPDYPYAPDSTIAHWTLPQALPPGDSLVVEIEWQARPSTLPRRQGRRGRRFDFAQWYPKVVVYDRYGWEDHPLYPAGEFYGEFATYDVTLDVPEDQVIGSTGVPVCGDPGWERARAVPGSAIDYQRDAYGVVPNECPAAAPGRKTVRFRAEQVHHFAFSLNPEYRYEEGRYGHVVVRVLYQPQDTVTWGRGLAVQRTETALAWLDSLFGPFAWPQLTNVHRIEGGGTEFPMMVMDGSAGLGLILHEVGHNYTMGVLANNEWREGFLDEGFTSFQTSWFAETHGGESEYPDLEANIVFDDLDRWSEPVSMISERYRDFFLYNEMIYDKAQLFYEQLRYVVGDETMRRILRTYYARWKLKHVNEAAFREVCEEVSGQDLGWLFGQWLHGTPLIDYELQEVKRRRLDGGRWEVTVTIRRKGDGWMPVEIGDRSHIYARATGQPEIERVTFVTDSAPGRLMLDPRVRAHDWNMLNNAQPRGLGSRRLIALRLDNPTRDVVRRDRIAQGLMPVAWSNDAGGVTLGLRSRSNYLGRFERGLIVFSRAIERDSMIPGGIYVRWQNPVAHLAPRTTTTVAAWAVEGRAGALLSWDRSLRKRWVDRADQHVGLEVLWMATTNVRWLDPALWDDAGSVEAEPWFGATWSMGRTSLEARLGSRVGVVYRYPGPGIESTQRYDVEGFWRPTAWVALRRPLGGGVTLAARWYLGAYHAHSFPPRQRRIGIGGADPYTTFTNPLLRSRGALFVRPDFHYHAPGDANLRAFSPALGGRSAASMNVELAKRLFSRRTGLVRELAILGFADAGSVDTLAVPTTGGRRWTNLYDAGVGLVATQAIGDLTWTTRFELPFVVNRWDFAADRAGSNDGRVRFRWQVSLAPSF